METNTGVMAGLSEGPSVSPKNTPTGHWGSELEEQTAIDIFESMWQLDEDILTNLLSCRDTAPKLKQHLILIEIFKNPGLDFRPPEDKLQGEKLLAIKAKVKVLRDNYQNFSEPDFILAIDDLEKNCLGQMVRISAENAGKVSVINDVIELFELALAMYSTAMSTAMSDFELETLIPIIRRVRRVLSTTYWIRWRWFGGNQRADTSPENTDFTSSGKGKGKEKVPGVSIPHALSLEDLDIAIEMMQILTEDRHPDDPDGEGQYSIDAAQLSLLFCAKYQQTRVFEDLNEALTWSMIGVESDDLPKDLASSPDLDVQHALRHMWSRYRQANMLSQRLQYQWNPSDVQQAQSMASEAIYWMDILKHELSPRQERRICECYETLHTDLPSTPTNSPSMIDCSLAEAFPLQLEQPEATVTMTMGEISATIQGVHKRAEVFIPYLERLKDKAPSDPKLAAALATLHKGRLYQNNYTSTRTHNLTKIKDYSEHSHSSLPTPSIGNQTAAHIELYRQNRDPRLRDELIEIYENNPRLYGDSTFSELNVGPIDTDPTTIVTRNDLNNALRLVKLQEQLLFMKNISTLYLTRFQDGGAVDDVFSAIAVAIELVCTLDHVRKDFDPMLYSWAVGPLLAGAVSERLDGASREWCREQLDIVLDLMAPEHEGAIAKANAWASWYNKHAMKLVSDPMTVVSERLDNVRITASFLWGTNGTPLGISSASEIENYHAFNTGLEYLPTTGTLTLDEIARRKSADFDPFSQLTAIYGKACSLGLNLRRPAKEALRLLEYTRAPMIGNIIDYRTGMGNLQKLAPGLSSEWSALMTEIDRGYTEPLEQHPQNPDRMGLVGLGEADSPLADASEARDRYSRRLETLRDQIRLVPGYEHFLGPLPLDRFGEEAMRAAGKGDIVFINVNEVGQYAILVTAKGFKPIDLQFTVTEAKEQMRLLDSSHRDLDSSQCDLDPLEANGKMLSVLRWLWEKVVYVVLKALKRVGNTKVKGKVQRGKSTDFNPTTIKSLPQIWWIGGGVLARAPFHSAGIYTVTGDKAQYAAMYCVSNYASTIKALLHCRSDRAGKHRVAGSYLKTPRDKVLLITMPTTPPSAPLAGTQTTLSDLKVDIEAEKLESVAQKLGLECTWLKSPAVNDVVKLLPSHNIVHFACHGVAHPTDPLASYLVLQKPATDEAGAHFVRDALSTRQILGVPIGSPGGQAIRTGVVSKLHSLAYVSACSSASDLSHSHSNEGIHIASALQVAGFDNVVGTLWDSFDETCSQVAQAFYEFLLQAEHDLSPAQALHLAVQGVRTKDEYSTMPKAWAGFICWGA